MNIATTATGSTCPARACDALTLARTAPAAFAAEAELVPYSEFIRVSVEKLVASGGLMADAPPLGAARAGQAGEVADDQLVPFDGDGVLVPVAEVLGAVGVNEGAADEAADWPASAKAGFPALRRAAGGRHASWCGRCRRGGGRACLS